jgi:capsule biosynthesis phosphatase
MRIKKIIVDVDDTLTVNNSSKDYRNKLPRLDVIDKLNEYRKKGYEIIIYSARNMNIFNGDVSKILVHTLPVLTEWLEKYKVEYDGIIMGKPWCGHDGFYIDDRAIRPDEFVNLSEDKIQEIINKG